MLSATFGMPWAMVVTGNDKYDFLNSALQVVGLGAATHQLATTDVKNYTAEKKFIQFEIK